MKCYYLFSAVDSVSKDLLLLVWITDVSSVTPWVWIYIIPLTEKENHIKIFVWKGGLKLCVVEEESS